MKTTRNERHAMRRHGFSAVSPIVAHGMVAAFTMPQGARAVHQGGSDAVPAAAQRERARRAALPAAPRIIWYSSGERTPLGRHFDFTTDAAIAFVGARRVRSEDAE